MLSSGFGRSQVAVVVPERASRFIGPDTRIAAITVRDPLGKIQHYSLLNPLGNETYTTLSFKRLIRGLNHLRQSQGYTFKIVAEGPGAWQLADPHNMRKFSIDHVIVGEFTTSTVPSLFKRLADEEDVPGIVHATYTDLSDTLPVHGGVTEGTVEVARGCNRRCHFCTVPRLQCRPLEDIITEARINIQHRQCNITLRSDDILSYQAEGTTVNRDAVLNLYTSIESLPGIGQISQSYLNLASAASEPSLIGEITETIGAGSKQYPYTTALVGVESGSPRIVEKYMPGKTSPFKPSEWPEVVEQGFGICNDNNWVPLGMFILGFPDETEADTRSTMALVENLKRYKSILIPFIFEARGPLNHEKSFNLRNMKREHLDLAAAILTHNMGWAWQLLKEQASNISRLGWLLPTISPLVNWATEKVHSRLFSEIAASTHPAPSAVSQSFLFGHHF